MKSTFTDEICLLSSIGASSARSIYHRDLISSKHDTESKRTLSEQVTRFAHALLSPDLSLLLAGIETFAAE